MKELILILLSIAVGFISGLYCGKQIERELWRDAVTANLKRWRQECLNDSWLGDK